MFHWFKQMNDRRILLRISMRTMVFALCFSLVFGPGAQVRADVFNVNSLPQPGAMLGISPAFVPALVRGLIVDPQKPLNFQFIVDSGNGAATTDAVRSEGARMVRYFLAFLTVPEKDLWVNLSPYEHDRMIADGLGKTVLGRDLLAQDYVLKQLTASLIYPEKGLGKEFWAKVYAEARSQFGTIDIPVDTFNKVWIMPERAEIFEQTNRVYVTGAKLKVMLDSDYVAIANNTAAAPSITRQIIREIVLPAIEKEVNEGKNFAPLRQIYYTAILAKWYRDAITQTLLKQAYLGKNKVAGIDSGDVKLKEEIYARYIAAYKVGVFNYIKEEKDPLTNEAIPHKYFSGGMVDFAMNHVVLEHALNVTATGGTFKLGVQLLKASRQVESELQSDSRDSAMSSFFSRRPDLKPESAFDKSVKEGLNKAYKEGRLVEPLPYAGAADGAYHVETGGPMAVEPLEFSPRTMIGDFNGIPLYGLDKPRFPNSFAVTFKGELTREILEQVIYMAVISQKNEVKFVYDQPRTPEAASYVQGFDDPEIFLPIETVITKPGYEDGGVVVSGLLEHPDKWYPGKKVIVLQGQDAMELSRVLWAQLENLQAGERVFQQREIQSDKVIIRTMKEQRSAIPYSLLIAKNVDESGRVAGLKVYIFMRGEAVGQVKGLSMPLGTVEMAGDFVLPETVAPEVLTELIRQGDFKGARKTISVQTAVTEEPRPVRPAEEESAMVSGDFSDPVFALEWFLPAASLLLTTVVAVGVGIPAWQALRKEKNVRRGQLQQKLNHRWHEGVYINANDYIDVLTDNFFKEESRVSAWNDLVLERWKLHEEMLALSSRLSSMDPANANSLLTMAELTRKQHDAIQFYDDPFRQAFAAAKGRRKKILTALGRQWDYMTGHDVDNPDGKGVFASLDPDIARRLSMDVYRLIAPRMAADAAPALSENMVQEESAMTGSVRQEKMDGGIDIQNIGLTKSGASADIQYDVAQAQGILDGGFEGFAPVITSVIPMVSPQQALGVH
ncbi:MAG: hypothetical protein HQL19_01215 [Candidatus Omnitrophica bacterium]|nr:hypothetical protein [Candidatus Omnitrophota bacterium]